MRIVSRSIFSYRALSTRIQPCSVSRIRFDTTHSTVNHSRKPTSFLKHQLATMSSKSTQSLACCNTPAIVTKGYEPKGKYIEVDGLKTCASALHSPSPPPPDIPRHNRPFRRQARHPTNLRHLRLLPSDTSRRRHPRVLGL
jgi:hypothetical protein